MLKILVLTKNNPVEILDVMTTLYNGVSGLDPNTIIVSPQYTALEISQLNGIPYLDAFYPAIASFKKVDDFAIQHNMTCDKGAEIDTIVVVGAVDKVDLLTYHAIVGLDNPDIEDYKEFNEDFNKENIQITTLANSDIIFKTKSEVIEFIQRMKAIDKELYGKQV